MREVTKQREGCLSSALVQKLNCHAHDAHSLLFPLGPPVRRSGLVIVQLWSVHGTIFQPIPSCGAALLKLFCPRPGLHS